jgi:hypothetical protein
MTIKWRKTWFPVKYAFCPTEADYHRAMKTAKVKDDPYPDSAGCCIQYYDKNDDSSILVVVNVDWVEEPVHAISVLVHECVHVVQWIIESMEDKEPSHEFQAYATQAVFTQLLADISEYRRSIGALPAS